MSSKDSAAQGRRELVNQRYDALELAFRWIAKLPEGRPDSTATCAYVPADVYERIKAALDA